MRMRLATFLKNNRTTLARCKVSKNMGVEIAFARVSYVHVNFVKILYSLMFMNNVFTFCSFKESEFSLCGLYILYFHLFTKHSKFIPSQLCICLFISMRLFQIRPSM